MGKSIKCFSGHILVRPGWVGLYPVFDPNFTKPHWSALASPVGACGYGKSNIARQLE